MCIVSVVIPTYKNRGALKDAILSVLKQDYNNIEIIVVDDNDPSSVERKSTEIVMSEFADDKRVTYIKHQKNKNGAAARNTGIKASKGKYISFLDDDDLFLPNKLKKQLNFLDMHPEFAGVYCHALRNGKQHLERNDEGDATKQMLLLETFMQTSLLMFRRESIISINGFDEDFRRHQDYDLMLRFFHAGFKIGCIPEPLVELGINEGENIPSGKKLEETKQLFFDKFMPYIEEIDAKEHGFKNKVLAKHYAGVFLNHLKHHNLSMANRTFWRYFWKSPTTFTSVLANSLFVHLKGEA